MANNAKFWGRKALIAADYLCVEFLGLRHDFAKYVEEGNQLFHFEKNPNNQSAAENSAQDSACQTF